MMPGNLAGVFALALCAIPADVLCAQIEPDSATFTQPSVDLARDGVGVVERLPPLAETDDSAGADSSFITESLASYFEPPIPLGQEPASTEPTRPSLTSSDERFGEAPPDDTRVFLRQSAVLLSPGTVEVEYGIRYTLQENDFLAVLPDGRIVAEFTDVRQVVGSLAVRYGLAERWQPYLILPVGFSWFERANSSEQAYDVRFGLGDIVAGVNFLVRDGRDECADIVLGLSFTAPTGKSTFVSLDPDFAPLGNGFWGVGVGLTFIRTYDPIVLFGTVGYGHQFGREFFDRHVQPGEELNYAFGAGFAVNDDITLSSQLQSFMQFDFFLEGERIPDSGTEAAVLRHSVVRRVCQQSFVEFFLLHGLTDDAARLSVGVLSTRRY